MKHWWTIGILFLGLGCRTTLDIATVSAPDVNCVFDNDCTITVDDSSDEFTLSGMAGSGFLQSRLFPPGEPGTPAAGLHAYLYRLDARNMVGILNIECAYTMSLDFGPVVALDYDGNGDTDQVFVVTGGGIGTVGLAEVRQSGDRLTFRFNPAVCAGSSRGQGDSSFFFGLTSASAPHGVQAVVVDGMNNTYVLDARAPNF